MMTEEFFEMHILTLPDKLLGTLVIHWGAALGTRCSGTVSCQGFACATPASHSYLAGGTYANTVLGLSEESRDCLDLVQHCKDGQ